MKFLWAELLWLLVLVPLLAAWYVRIARRRSLAAGQFPGLVVAAPARAWLRHLPAVLFLLSLAAMIVAIARPVAVITLPSQHATVVLAIDVSGSMKATDIKPTRLAAAQAAARTFVDEQPRGTRIGIVAFAASASVVQHPTHDRDAVRTALDRLQTQPGTALGSGIVVALASLFPGQGITVESVQNAATWRQYARSSKSPEGEKQKAKAAAEIGNSGAIVVLTDGQANTGVPPPEAARAAAERNVRVFTIGMGTAKGELLTLEGWRARPRLDETTLKDIARATRAQYFYGGDARELKEIYRTLHSRFLMQKRETEITALVAGAAVLVAVISAFLSLLWFNRIL